MSSYQYATVPSVGDTIAGSSDQLAVPDRPIIPFIEGTESGPIFGAATQHVVDAAVAKSYGRERREIAWMEVFAGAKAHEVSANGFPRRRWTR